MKDIFAGHKRIIILQCTEKLITMSNVMAQKLLRTYGHSLAIEEVNALFIFLQERNLVKLRQLDEDIWTIELTRKGRDIALGLVREQGIDLPVED
ncbi:MAG: hypothetical protein ACRC5H_05760 [Treponemataceae bacterium]